MNNAALSYQPEGLYDRIEKEPEDTCIYKRIKLDYTHGLHKIYTNEEIEKAKHSPSFSREYNLEYLGGIGNVFNIEAITKCQIEYEPKILPDVKTSVGIDPSFGSSSFGIVVTQFVNGYVRVVVAEEH